VQVGYLGAYPEPIPASLPLNGLVPVTITAPSTPTSFITKLVVTAPGATITEWPIYVEAN
jgi:hypothetical protein